MSFSDRVKGKSFPSFFNHQLTDWKLLDEKLMKLSVLERPYDQEAFLTAGKNVLDYLKRSGATRPEKIHRVPFTRFVEKMCEFFCKLIQEKHATIEKIPSQVRAKAGLISMILFMEPDNVIIGSEIDCRTNFRSVAEKRSNFDLVLIRRKKEMYVIQLKATESGSSFSSDGITLDSMGKSYLKKKIKRKNLVFFRKVEDMAADAYIQLMNNDIMSLSKIPEKNLTCNFDIDPTMFGTRVYFASICISQFGKDESPKASFKILNSNDFQKWAKENRFVVQKKRVVGPVSKRLKKKLDFYKTVVRNLEDFSSSLFSQEKEEKEGGGETEEIEGEG